ncbi:MAG: hypothetical protein ACI9IA_001011, partial [Enterobacterales bacterium]
VKFNLSRKKVNKVVNRTSFPLLVFVLGSTKSTNYKVAAYNSVRAIKAQE